MQIVESNKNKKSNQRNYISKNKNIFIFVQL